MFTVSFLFSSIVIYSVESYLFSCNCHIQCWDLKHLNIFIFVLLNFFVIGRIIFYFFALIVLISNRLEQMHTLFVDWKIIAFKIQILINLEIVSCHLNLKFYIVNFLKKKSWDVGSMIKIPLDIYIVTFYWHSQLTCDIKEKASFLCSWFYL